VDIASQSGEYIVNVENNTQRQRDHLRTGIALLRDGHYGAAVRELARAIDEAPGDADTHYYLALAMLHGLRPNRLSRGGVDSVRRHLKSAGALPEARVLLVMVDEDYGLRWRDHTEIPQALIDLVALVEGDRAGELLAHVPAKGTRTRQVLEAAVAGDEPDGG
jgi:hypothetical protein